MMYDSRFRRSLGHQMQDELRNSMQTYRNTKQTLQNQFSGLRFDIRDLYTSPLPPSPPLRSDRSDLSSLQSWKKPGSKFNGAPDKAQKQARLAKLQQENSSFSKETDSLTDHELNGKKASLPPISTQSTDVTDGASGEQPTSTNQSDMATDVSQKNLRFGGRSDLKTPQKTPVGKPAKKTKKAKAAKPMRKEKSPYVGRLPTIHAVDPNRPHWDSGQNHIHRKGPSTSMEKSQVEEDCRTFTQRSVQIPDADDPKRTEIRLPPITRATGPKTKVKFVGRSPRRPFVNGMYTDTSVGASGRKSPLARNPDLSASCEELQYLYDSEDEESHTEQAEEDRQQDSDKLHPSTLPVVRLSQSKLSEHDLQATTQHVPRLRLDSEATPSMVSEVTGRSGATGATYMSQETLEWKEAYMGTGNPERKSRVLAEILHVVRQRMQDNEEDLRLAGYDPRGLEKVGVDYAPIDLMVLAGKKMPASGDNTARSTKSSRSKQGSKKTSPNRQLVIPGIRRSHRDHLHNYMQRMSQRRRVVEHQQRVRFQLAHMTIREITQSSLGHSMQPAA